jgi:hypothetical protein
MSLLKTNMAVLDRKDPIELTLELLSFSGGENTIGTDKELENNEARIIENWDAISVGGMERSLGFKLEADGTGSWTSPIDLLIQHIEGTTTRLYAVTEGDLVYENGAALTQADDNCFTSGVLTHGVSVGGKLYLTNSTDNIKYKTIAANITALPDPPTEARERLFYHKFRLIAEGGGRRVYGSRAGSANFTAADAFSLINDAWNIDLPLTTRGSIQGFPSGDDFIVFTEMAAYSLYNQPNIAYSLIAGSHGCSAPYSIAKGDEGVYFVSKFPSLGVFLYNGVNWTDITVKHDFVDEIDFTKRIFGVYRNGCYYLIYNELGSGVTYPNVLRIYDSSLGRWMKRPINSAVGDSFGYPVILSHSTNQLYFGSSVTAKLYDFETEDNSDNGYNTQANYKTKDFTSSDFAIGSGGKFPIDEVRVKLTKILVECYGTKGIFSVQWTADRGKHSGSQIFDLQASGDLINTTFTVNTSLIVTLPPDITITKSFSNSAVGRRFNFQILNSNTGERPKIKKIKIHAVCLEEA